MEAPLHLPRGWFPSGATPERYEMGIAGPGSPALIRSRTAQARDEAVREFGTLMQNIAAKKFIGQRLRLTAELRAENVDGVATIWMRVDGSGRRSIAFDNMEQRATDGVLSGTTGWIRREVILDVPSDAESIHFGFYLRGSGRAWARTFALAPVSTDVAVTGGAKSFPEQPVNLDFSELGPETG